MTPAHATPLPEQLASKASLIVDSVQQTVYQHTSSIDVDRGVYDCDCNGFVSLVMERAAPDHYAMVPKEADQTRPRAFEYYVFFSGLTTNPASGWHRIELLADARRGDILAWRFPTVEKGHDTGHVVIVAETPVEDDAGIFRVVVYDSAAQAHFDDTRGSGEGQFPSGVGSGEIRFKVDSLGKPQAFQFAPGDGFVVLPIAVGRVEPL